MLVKLVINFNATLGTSPGDSIRLPGSHRQKKITLILDAGEYFVCHISRNNKDISVNLVMNTNIIHKYFGLEF